MLAALGSCLLAACLIRNVERAAPRLNTGFIRAGSTSRAEIEARFQTQNTGVQLENYFLGRNVRVMGSFNWIAAMGGPGGISGGSGRHDPPPKVRNFVIEFDERDFVVRYRVFSDERLISELRRLAVQAERLPDAEEPHRLKVDFLHEPELGSFFGYVPAVLVLGKESVAIDRKTRVPRLARLANGRGAAGLKAACDPLRTLPLGGLLQLENERNEFRQCSAGALYAAGVTYFQGCTVPRDDTKAVKWLRKAAELGHSEARMLLGTMFAKGIGVPLDEAKAAQWLRRARQQDGTTLLTVSPRDITRLKPASQPRRSGPPATENIDLTLHFSERTAYGKRVTFKISLRDSLRLVRYLISTGVL